MTAGGATMGAKMGRSPAFWIAIAWSLFQLYSAGFGRLPVLTGLPVHVSLALALTFSLYPTWKQVQQPGQRVFAAIVNALPVLVSLLLGAYMVAMAERIHSRVGFVDPVTNLDLMVGILYIVLVLEACRRLMGWSLPILGIVFLLYQFLGPWIPGFLGNSGISWHRMIDLQVLSPQGLFGLPVRVAANYVFYFVLFATFYELSGGGKSFMDLAIRLAGRFRGGPAKAAVVGSSLMGTITGSVVANVAGTGSFTIPLMKKIGYPSRFAGAVEASASTGGQIMPPIMGAAAFVMAEILGVPYSRVVLAAVIPALIYYAALFLIVDLKAAREGLKGMSSQAVADFSQGMMGRLHMLLPLVYLVYQILDGSSLMLSASRATVAVVLVALVRKSTRMSLMNIIAALESSAKKALAVTLPCAVSGMVVAVVINSGLGFKISRAIVGLSAGNLTLALVLVMIVSLIMGLGMPTAAAYITVSVLGAPALVTMGVPNIAAHMFVFYFACLSMITPPIALASYAASAIAESRLWETSLVAFQLSLAGFLVPFAFVYSPALLFEGELVRTLLGFGTALLGTYSLAGAVVGYLRCRAYRWEILLLFVASLLLIAPGHYTDVVGLGLLAGVYWWQSRRPAGMVPASDQVQMGAGMPT